MEKCKCKCGHEWKPKVKYPKSCPKCKRYDWKEVKVMVDGVKSYGKSTTGILLGMKEEGPRTEYDASDKIEVEDDGN